MTATLALMMSCWKVKCALDNVTVEYITARVAELTRLRGDDNTKQHYYALSAGIFELLSLLNYLNKQH